MKEDIKPICECTGHTIKSLQGHADFVLKKEKSLIANGYTRTYLPKVGMLYPGEYVLRSSYGYPVKILFWLKP